MPDHAAVTSALALGIDNAALFHAIIKGGDAFYQGFNAKHLLITRHNAPVLFVEQAKQTRHFQQSVMAQQRHQKTILIRYQQIPTRDQSKVGFSRFARSMIEQGI